MTDEEIHNIYLHMSGKAEGLVEATGTADFPVLFARAILEYEGLTKDAQNMASKSTYKEQLKTKDEPFEYWNAVEGWVKIDEVREHFESVSCGTIYKNEGEGRVPLYASPQPRKPLPPNSPCEMTQAEGKMFKLGWLECEAAHGIKE